MIHTVMFDLGGVLIEDPSASMVTYFANYFQVNREVLQEALQKHWDAWHRGDLSEQDLWTQATADLHIQNPPYDSLWLDGFRRGWRENREMFLLLKQLKARGYSTILLSNTETPLTAYFKQCLPDIDRYFFSCEMGLRKPEPAIYEKVLHEMECQPEAVLFIDDRPENIEAAAALGIAGLVFRSCAALREQLPHYRISL
ncbi:MAG TPA: HAD-IA family hydrolase [Ktedonobacteraceae bacterium]